MKKILLFTVLTLLVFQAARAAEPASPPLNHANFPPRLKRADSFLGVHFDFHAGKDCTEIGKHTTRAMIENIIQLVHPDYLQIDCKGHPGLSSYPTKVGHQAPGFVGDPLRLWRQVTAERGVSLYMHYSGVWDTEAIRRHPAWAALNVNGTNNGRATSVFGPYADQLLIPQLCELAGDYGVDGAWVDGECWADVPDYGMAALAAFQRGTRFQAVPRKPGEPHWLEFLDFQREAFRRYLRHYVTEVKKNHPRFELCSNWAFTDHMAEPVSAPVDFLSGDYSPEDSVNSARVSGRYLVRQGKPWDLMAWSFTRRPGKTGTNQKTAVQLQREAAVVVALGGGFQAYFKQKRDGSIYDERMPVMAEVARFCRERQALCHRAESVPQVALLLSTAAHYRKIQGLFSRDLAQLSGVLQALLESQYSVEIVGEHHLAGRMREYPLIVIPEWEYLEPQFKADLTAYVKGGGSLLLVGPGSATLFPTELGVTPKGELLKAETTVQIEHAGIHTSLRTRAQSVQLAPKASPVGAIRWTNGAETVSQPAASITPLGRGQIAATYFNIGRGYASNRNEGLRRFLNDLARQLFPKPMVEVAGAAVVDVHLARNRGKLLVNLVNTAGPHQSEPILETIPPLGPLEVLVRSPKKPVRVNLEPGGRSLPFAYAAGEAKFTVPTVPIHAIAVVEF